MMNIHEFKEMVTREMLNEMDFEVGFDRCFLEKFEITSRTERTVFMKCFYRDGNKAVITYIVSKKKIMELVKAEKFGGAFNSIIKPCKIV